MNCPQVRDGLPLYVGGDLAESERIAVEEHLEGCAGCRSLLDRTRQVIAPLRNLGPIDAPVPDAERLWAGIAADMGWASPEKTRPEEPPASTGGRPLWRRGSAWLRAAAVFAVGIGIGFAFSLVDGPAEKPARNPARPPLSAAMSRPDFAARPASPAAESPRYEARLPLTTFGDFGFDSVRPVDALSGGERRFFVWNAFPPKAAPSRRDPAPQRFHLEQIRTVDGEDLVAGY